MYYPKVDDSGNTRGMIDTWLGYNHNYKINQGEFYDMENMSSDNFPLLSPRKVRQCIKECKKDYNEEKKVMEYKETFNGILYTDKEVVYLKGTTLYYRTREFDLSPYMEADNKWQTLIRMGANIIMFPAKVYVNPISGEMGRLDAEVKGIEGTTITYDMCRVDGSSYNNLVRSETPPEDPTDGMYWYNTREDARGLNIWYKALSMWQPVATTYIMITVPGDDIDLRNHFAEGDSVTMNSMFSDINNGSLVRAIDKNYIIVTGLLEGDPDSWHQTNDSSWQFTIRRAVPDLNYVCLDKNRLWGCIYSEGADGTIINEIYASKLGDPKNWNQFQGISTDSYRLSVGAPGLWTGCISFQGNPVFFKDNVIIKIYGSMPSNYQMSQTDARGVQYGSSRSLAIVDELLFYKSNADICAYDGSYPVSVSDALGRETKYYNAVGGGFLGKYRVSMQDYMGKYIHFIYDTQRRIWSKEDELELKQITASESGDVYGTVYGASDHKIYALGSSDKDEFAGMTGTMAQLNRPTSEEWVNWWAETGDQGYEYPDFKYVSKIVLRAYVPHKSEIKVLISYDDRKYEQVAILRGNSDVMSQTMSIIPYRCDHYRIRFEGHGDVRIYSMTTSLEIGSDEDGYTH